MEKTLRELVDDLPTQSLDLYVAHYEAGEVGGYEAFGFPHSPLWRHVYTRCPCASLGFRAAYGTEWDHPAHQIEQMARANRLDTAALYTECVIALTERDGAGLPEPEVVGG